MVLDVSRMLGDALDDGHFPVLIAGDCPAPLGGLITQRRARSGAAGLVFADGHEDAWEPVSSPTGDA